MFRSPHLRAVGLALALAAIVGCSSKKTAIYEHESFDDSGTFSRSYPVNDAATCEAGRRALLSQGYIITSNDPKLISGHKSFQQTGETHLEISFNLVCAEDGGTGHRTTLFANALQDRYALKKTNNSASLGVGVLGSVSMPIGSSDDSMVKVASETVSSAKFYERFFALVEVFLPAAEPKKVPESAEKPSADLGVPEAGVEPAALAPVPDATEPQPALAPAPAPDPAPVLPASEAAPAPVQTAPIVSEPVAPPAEPAPIEPAPVPEPEPAPAAPEPVDLAPPSESLPAPTEPIQPLPAS